MLFFFSTSAMSLLYECINTVIQGEESYFVDWLLLKFYLHVLLCSLLCLGRYYGITIVNLIPIYSILCAKLKYYSTYINYTINTIQWYTTNCIIYNTNANRTTFVNSKLYLICIISMLNLVSPAVLLYVFCCIIVLL